MLVNGEKGTRQEKAKMIMQCETDTERASQAGKPRPSLASSVLGSLTVPFGTILSLQY